MQLKIKLQRVGGPIVMSVLSLFLLSLFIQLVASFFDPAFNLLANRGAGKIIFTSLVILHVLLLLKTQSQKYVEQWRRINISFFYEISWIRSFLTTFFVFFMFHAMLIVVLLVTPNIFITSVSSSHWSLSFVLKVLFGFCATFFLAWTEELIFRGTLYTYLAQYFLPVTSAFVTSVVFMFAHDITNPLNLVAQEWRLGLGLFLLGIILNFLFIITDKKLYVGMGAHAGLVFVKVLQRRIPLLGYTAVDQWPWWFARDLRQSHLVHMIFLVAITVFFVLGKDRLLSDVKSPHDDIVYPPKAHHTNP